MLGAYALPGLTMLSDYALPRLTMLPGLAMRGAAYLD